MLVQQERQVGGVERDVGTRSGTLAHAVAHRVLHPQGREAQAAQRRPARGRVDAQALVRGDPLVPANAASEFVDAVLVTVLADRDPPEHALREPALEVQRQHEPRRPGGGRTQADAAAHRLPLDARHARLRHDAVGLLAEEGLDPRGAGEKDEGATIGLRHARRRRRARPAALRSACRRRSRGSQT